MNAPTPVRYRPRRVRLVCGIAAAATLLLCIGLSTGLRGRTGDGYGQFRAGDQAAMIGLGVLAGLAFWVLTRPRVDADTRTVRVRNLVSGYELPWTTVRRVAFDRGSPWASLELLDDESVAVLALQAIDREHAVAAVRALRALHEAAGQVDPQGERG